MTTLDILICTLNKGIVRIPDNLLPPCEGIGYVVSYQYTESRFLELIPPELEARKDVRFIKYQGVGLSANRNVALRAATADLVIFADDDARFVADDLYRVVATMDEHAEVDVGLFQASTYTGRLLKHYPEQSMAVAAYQKKVSISALEMVCRRDKIQGRLAFDERFGLGTKFLTCGEEVVWLYDARRLGLNIRYFPQKLLSTSTLLKQHLIYVDPGVQRAKGAIAYYKEGMRAWVSCLRFSLSGSLRGLCHFFPMMRHLAEGIIYLQRNRS